MINLLPVYKLIKISGKVPYILKVKVSSPDNILSLSAAQEITCSVGDLLVLTRTNGDISVSQSLEDTLNIQIPALGEFFESELLPTTFEFSIILKDVAGNNLLIAQGLFYVE